MMDFSHSDGISGWNGEGENADRRGCCGCNPCCCRGPAQDDVFAYFKNYALRPDSGSLLPLDPVIVDPTGQIVTEDNERILLETGYYLVSYQVSGLMKEQGYMQITPFYNNIPHLDEGIYYMTGTGGGSADGSAYFIVEVPAETSFSLTFNSSVVVTEVQTTITFLKLRRKS